MITLHKAKTNDFMSIAQLDAIVWQQKEDSRHFIVDGEHAWKKWVEYAMVFYAKNTIGEKVGAIVAFPTLRNGWCIHKIFVHPDYRQYGIGKGLMHNVLQDIDRKEYKIFLTVAPENTYAIKLYEDLGFKKKKLHTGYYRSHEDRYIMERPVQWADCKENKLMIAC